MFKTNSNLAGIPLSTQGKDLICIEGSYHGSTSTTTEVSHKSFLRNGGRKNHVHVLPLPEQYRYEDENHVHDDDDEEKDDDDDDDDDDDGAVDGETRNDDIDVNDVIRKMSSGKNRESSSLDASTSSSFAAAKSSSSPSSSSSKTAAKMISQATRYVNALSRADRPISAFISEALMTHAGMTSPPPGYLAAVYDAVR